MTPGSVTLAVHAGLLADHVVARLARAVAAQAGLPIDRVRDLSTYIDAMLSELSTDRIAAHFVAGRKTVEVALGPLMVGEGSRILSATAHPGLGPLTHWSNDRIWADSTRGSVSYICVSIGDEPPAG